MNFLVSSYTGRALKEVTIYEHSTFCLNTVLSDIAERHMALRDRIIEHQLRLLHELVDDLVEYARNTETPHNIAAKGEHYTI